MWQGHIITIQEDHIIAIDGYGRLGYCFDVSGLHLNK